MPACSHNSNLVGDFESVVVLGKDHVGLLLATGGDKGVYLADFDLVKLLASLFDHRLGGALVNHEDKGVVVFNSLDGTFGAAGELDHGELVPGVLLLDRVGDSFSLAGKGQGLGASESGFGPDLVLLRSVNALFGDFGNCLRLNSSISPCLQTLHLPVWS